ncbi:MAG: hypothetical protein V3T64_16650, partial [Myxococcota bacterium]
MSAPLFDGLPPLAPDDAANARAVRVALPVPVDQLFDYRVPTSHTAGIAPGIRVRVRFAGQQLTGLVVPRSLAGSSTRPHPDAKSNGYGRKLAVIDAVLDQAPVVSEPMMRILGAAAREIFAPIGLALAHALPPGSTARSRHLYRLTPRGQRALAQGALGAASLGGDARPILTRLAERPATRAALSKAFPRIDVPRRLTSLTHDGLVQGRNELRSASARIPTERIAQIAPGVAAAAVAQTELARAPRQGALLRQIAATREGIPTQRLTRRDKNVAALLRALASRRLIVIEERPRPSATESILDAGQTVSLTADQAQV